ncbi:PilC/PilY family type IV pilus protein [Acinetobacter pittii]|uniref:pilus assembly protein n=1 Tax=Acinetobacter pittii TaxID=48296 RepID=UPI00313D2A12
MKQNVKIITFKLSVLSTLMLCITANNYASDIEIYKAPTKADGNAKIMLVLDISTYMYQDPGYNGGGTTQPTDADFGVACNGSQKSYPEIMYAGTSYEYTANYCEVSANQASAAAKAGCFTNLQRPNASPSIPSNTYRCYDRLSTLKESLFAIIDNPNYAAAENQTDTTKPKISLGFSFFPTGASFGPPMAPQLLNAVGRDRLKQRISDLKAGDTSEQGLPFPFTNNDGRKAQVAQAYGNGVQQLISSANVDTNNVRQCSGYGVYTLTSGIPDNDVVSASGGAKELLTNVLSVDVRSNNPLFGDEACGLYSDSNTSSDSYRSWRCIAKAAELLMAGKSSLNMPIRTAVVSMGKSFGFYGVNSSTDFNEYTGSTTLQSIEQRYNDIYRVTANSDRPTLENRRYAVRAGTLGGGGYYAVSNSQALQKSIDDFILKTLKVDIPYITTGAPTIPQDPLNPAIVQSDAYYSQFKPTPTLIETDASRLWVGNLKKYHINSLGRLFGKNDQAVLSSLGRLEPGTHDFWAPSVSSNEVIAGGDENTLGSELYARMGGVKAQLSLGSSIVNGVTVTKRNLLTNRLFNSGVASERTTLSPIKTDYTTSDPKHDDLMSLLQLRQIGAVMHSSPLLISNKGKMAYDAETNTLGTSNREDYVLFGTTQGVLHVVRAKDYLDTDSSTAGGKEVFAFVPHEMIENQSASFLTPEATSGGTANLFYGIDAPWTAYTEYVVDSEGNLTVGTGKSIGTDSNLRGKQLVYGGLRMGGRSYYALDLHDMSDPALKFHINPADLKVYFNNSNKTFDALQYMGQSWSKPKIAWVNWQGSRKLVMFVGGGYDAGYENDSYSQTNKIGAGVYMFDALNGDLLWWASDNAAATSNPTTNSGVIALKDPNLQYSVVSEIKTADRDNDGLVDHLYFGDLAGQVFRIDLNNDATTSGSFATRSIRLLNLHTSGGISPRFYSAPAFSTYRDNTTDNLFAVISVGSGNLSRPLVEYTSGRDYDALYSIYDKDVVRSDLYTTTRLHTQDVSLSNTDTALRLNEVTSENRFSNNTIVSPYATSSGWYFRFKGANNIAQQEKVFYSPTVIDYDLYVSSYDSSRLGLTGVCGGGVQGVSKVRLFCMPFGQCSSTRGFTSEANASDEHGPGIQNHAIGSDASGGTTRLIGGALVSNHLNDQYTTKVKLIAQRWYER